jgi:hypothetical protein
VCPLQGALRNTWRRRLNWCLTPGIADNTLTGDSVSDTRPLEALRLRLLGDRLTQRERATGAGLGF